MRSTAPGCYVAFAVFALGCGGGGSRPSDGGRTDGTVQDLAVDPTIRTHDGGDAAPDSGPSDSPPLDRSADGGVIEAGGPTVDGGPCVVAKELTLNQSIAYVPYAVGNRWTYRGSSRLAAGTTFEFQERVVVAASSTTGTTSTHFVEDTYFTGNPGTLQQQSEIGPDGLIVAGNSPNGAGAPIVLANTTPYPEIPFPIRTCSTIQQFSTVDFMDTVTSTATARAFETISGPLGSYADALRNERWLVHSNAAGAPTGYAVSVFDWYAPGVGRVRRVVNDGREFTYELVGSLIGGVGRGIVPMEAIASQLVVNSAPLGPNGPAVASDGANFLVIQATNKDYYDGGIHAVVVNPDGKAVTSAPLFHGMTAPYVPGIAFGAGRYLVVYAEVNQKTLWGLFVSPTGVVEGAPFAISQSNYPPPAVAFGAGVFVVARATAEAVIVNVVDPTGKVLSETTPYLSKNEAMRAGISSDGTNFLIAWAVRDPDPNTNATNATHITAGRVNAQGAALDTAVIPVSAETGIDESFDAAFQGGQHFVSWFHRPELSSLGSGTVRIARIGVDGSRLDGVPNPAGGHAVSFSKTPKNYPRLARFGSQLLAIWLLNDVSNFDRHIAGTRVDLNGLPLDSSPTSEGLWLSPQRDYADLPALAFGKDRALVAFALVSDKTWSLKDTLVFPW